MTKRSIFGPEHLDIDVDLDFEQTTTTTSVYEHKQAVSADDGAVAVGGSVWDSAISTAPNAGVIAGGPVVMDDSIVGSGNVQINDSAVGAFAGGDATNATGENVNLGSGRLTAVDAHGDAAVVSGDGSRLEGDTTVSVGSTGPSNVAVGDGNRQQAELDQSVSYEDSFNTDNSVSDSFNTSYEDSFNTSLEDNDTTKTVIEDSFKVHTEDNDITETVTEQTWTSESVFEDNDSWHQEMDQEMVELEIWGDDNMVDLD